MNKWLVFRGAAIEVRRSFTEILWACVGRRHEGYKLGERASAVLCSVLNQRRKMTKTVIKKTA